MEAQVELSQRTREILAAVDDTTLRGDVEQVVREALGALAALGRVHLPQDHFEEGTLPRQEGDKHLELAPYVLGAVAAINRMLAQMSERFPAPASAQANEAVDDDFDFDFDLVDGPTGEGAGLASSRPQSSLSPREQVADATHAFGSMVKSRVLSFGERLHHALAQDDSWTLLAELDDYQHGLSKAVQGTLFGILAVFEASVRREEILPEYRSSVSEAVELRGALTDLTYQINRFNAAIAGATSDQVVPLLVAVSDRLARFSARPEYRTLRAEDKKAIIDFRGELYSMRHRKEGVPLLPLRHAVEGFSKFLEAMQAINHREVLVVHDRQRLLEAQEQLSELRNLALLDLDSAQQRLPVLVRQLASVSGRNPELDEALRSVEPVAVPPEQFLDELNRWGAYVQATLAMVG